MADVREKREVESPVKEGERDVSCAMYDSMGQYPMFYWVIRTGQIVLCASFEEFKELENILGKFPGGNNRSKQNIAA